MARRYMELQINVQVLYPINCIPIRRVNIIWHTVACSFHLCIVWYNAFHGQSASDLESLRFVLADRSRRVWIGNNVLSVRILRLCRYVEIFQYQLLCGYPRWSARDSSRTPTVLGSARLSGDDGQSTKVSAVLRSAVQCVTGRQFPSARGGVFLTRVCFLRRYVHVPQRVQTTRSDRYDGGEKRVRVFNLYRFVRFPGKGASRTMKYEY